MSEKANWVKPIAKVYKKEDVIESGPTPSTAESGFTSPS